MILKGIIDSDTINYKKISMVLEFPICKNFKCDKECGRQVCQNMPLATAPDIDTDIGDIIRRYLNNSLTQAVILAGLEPFDTPNELFSFIYRFREYSDDDIVVYTGYTEQELSQEMRMLSVFRNIVVKFGRYIPNQQPHYDEVLGVNLASDNQYAKKIS